VLSSNCIVSHGAFSIHYTLEVSSLMNVMVFYREKVWHSKFAWHDNGTMTYTSQRNAIFEPALNKLSLNDTLILPNVALMVSNFGTEIEDQSQSYRLFIGGQFLH
jgi:hypothetical protein